MIFENMINKFISGRRSFRRALRPEPFSSHLFIIGAQKSGTTALHRYLEKSPEIVSGDSKEIGFFHRDAFFGRGHDYYRTCFPVFSSARCVLDSTPEYLYYSDVPKRIHSYAPDAKIVVILREPVSRAFSAYNMYSQLLQSRRKWLEYHLTNANKPTRDFFEAILATERVPSLSWFLEQEVKIIESDMSVDEPSLIRRGIYTPQIVRYIKTFGRSNVLIIFSDELKESAAYMTDRVLRFAGLSPVLNQEFSLHHVRDYRVDKSVEGIIHEIAHQWFAQDKLDLENELQIDVPW